MRFPCRSPLWKDGMLIIRRIQRGEGGLFRRMRLTSLQESPFAFASHYETALKRSEESWNEQADSTADGADRATFLAFYGDSPIGIAALYRDKEGVDRGELLQVWVAPDFRGKGVTSALMATIFRWAAESGFRTIHGAITRGNTRALTFYRKCGFILVEGFSFDGPDDPRLMKSIADPAGHEPS